jgi:hypothetical protein
MLRSFFVLLALLIVLSVKPIQAQTNLPDLNPSTEPSLIAASSSSMTLSDDLLEGDSVGDMGSPAVKSSNTLPNAENSSMRPFFHVAVAVELGFLGIGGQIATPLHDRGNLRLAGDAFSYSYLFNTNGFAINAKLNLRSVRLAYDFLPFRDSFHISPAVMLYYGNNFGGTVTVNPQTSVTINNTSYTSSPSDPIRGTPSVTFPKAAPALTIGWGNLLPRSEHSHLSFPFEIGGVYSGQPDIHLNLTGTACNSLGANCMPVATSPSIQANIAAQQNTYKNDYSWLRFYPIVQFGIGYKF